MSYKDTIDYYRYYIIELVYNGRRLMKRRVTKLITLGLISGAILTSLLLISCNDKRQVNSPSITPPPPTEGSSQRTNNTENTSGGPESTSNNASDSDGSSLDEEGNPIPSGDEQGGETGNTGPETPKPFGIKYVRLFMYQLQGLEEAGAVEALAKTHYDMLVVEPVYTVKGSEDFDVYQMVRAFKSSEAKNLNRKLVVAYIDIGEAEDYRTYWEDSWIAPKSQKCKAGSPSFLLRMDPDGWSGNYVVKYWDQRWVKIMVGAIEDIARKGFDGAYLDWVEAYDDECVINAAKVDNINPAVAMVNFVALLKAKARAINPNFVIISQNAPYLAEERPEYLKVIDAISMEGIFFLGEADSDWDDPSCCDIPNEYEDDFSTDALISVAKGLYIQNGIPVFSVDYAIKPENVAYVYKRAREVGLIPLVTRTSLSKITTTPPPDY